MQVHFPGALPAWSALFLYNISMNKRLIFCFLLGLLVSACSGTGKTPPQTASATPAVTSQPPTPTASAPPQKTATPTPTTTPQSHLLPAASGPDLTDFRAEINPLTGLQVQNASLLKLPAVLVSISNMPPTARPQAGLSFAPWVYELFIGEGTTRFMSVFYGDLPRRIANDTGGCEIRPNILRPSGPWVGNRAWLDENGNGAQDAWEAGVGGVCVRLLEAGSGSVLASISTDANGYYAFDASNFAIAKTYRIKFDIPAAYHFSPANQGLEELDSDPNPVSGELVFTYTGTNDDTLDAGLVLVNPGPAQYAISEIAPQRTYVGPIRSGRLTYNDFVNMYPASCLVYASAGDGIRQQLKGCEIIFGEEPGASPNTALLDISHLKELAEESKLASQPVNYSGHLFDPTPPPGGLPADSLWTYFHAWTQASWQYDPISGRYLRMTDDADGLGVFHADTDRLTGRQLGFENVAIIFADYQVFRHGQYDVDLCCGFEGYAFIFRDGQMYKARWNSANREWEKTTGLLRPLHFTGTDKKPFPLKPGRTWVSVMTINSAMLDQKDGAWKALFAMPNDYPPEP